MFVMSLKILNPESFRFVGYYEYKCLCFSNSVYLTQNIFLYTGINEYALLVCLSDWLSVFIH